MFGHNDWIMDMSFSPDGNIFVSQSQDGTILFWDTVTLQPIDLSMVEDIASAVGFTFSPNGENILFSYPDGTAIYRDVKTWRLLG